MKAYVTVFYSLIVSVCLMLLVGLLYGVRENALRMKADYSMNASMDAVMSEYNRELFKQYGLLFIDMSYQSETVGKVITEEHLKSYLNQNFNETTLGIWDGIDFLKLKCLSADITGLRIASDHKALAIRKQAVDYMLRESKIAYAEDFLKLIPQFEEIEVSGEKALADARERANEKKIDKDRVLKEAEIPVFFVEKEEDASLNFLSSLKLVIKDIDKISRTGINKENYISKRKSNKGNMDEEKEDVVESAVNKLLFRMYLNEVCGSYIENKKDSRLTYQLEYIIAGKDNDPDNLESVVNRLLMFRTGTQYMLLQENAVEKTAIKILSQVISVIILAPEAEEGIAQTIEIGLSTYRGVQDTKKLMAGEKMPLYGDDSAELGYGDYLDIFMYLTSTGTVADRFMDIIEMDIRNTKDNERFLIDNCFDRFEATAFIKSDYGYEYEIKREYDVTN